MGFQVLAELGNGPREQPEAVVAGRGRRPGHLAPHRPEGHVVAGHPDQVQALVLPLRTVAQLARGRQPELVGIQVQHPVGPGHLGDLALARMPDRRPGLLVLAHRHQPQARPLVGLRPFQAAIGGAGIAHHHLVHPDVVQVAHAVGQQLPLVHHAHYRHNLHVRMLSRPARPLP
jgi:hypothetical protein